MLRRMLVLLGLGVLVGGAVALVVGGLLLGPLLVWFAWNVLDLGNAVGAGELGFWGLVLAAVFLVLGLAGRFVIVAIVFLVDPAWLQRSATLHWPAPTFRNFVAICLLLIVASVSSHASGHDRRPAAPKLS